MSMTAEERTETQGYLREARQAYHRLQIGKSVKVIVDQNGERVEFTSANSDKLRSYIYALEVKLGLHTTSGPMNVWM